MASDQLKPPSVVTGDRPVRDRGAAAAVEGERHVVCVVPGELRAGEPSELEVALCEVGRAALPIRSRNVQKRARGPSLHQRDEERAERRLDRDLALRCVRLLPAHTDDVVDQVDVGGGEAREFRERLDLGDPKP